MQDQDNIIIADLEVVPASALEVTERAAIDIQINTAKRFPRDLAQVKRDMLSLATLDPETAASCFYTLHRKNADGVDKPIIGPSVRMAEIAANSFGHIHAVTRTVGNDGKMVTVQAVCHDLQKNVRIGTEVKRRITTKAGKTFSDDMIVVTTNAAQSIALRNAIFKAIPMALVKPVFEAARKAAVGDASTLATRREAVVARLVEMGAKRDAIFSSMGIKGIESIDLEKLELLIGIGTAIKDGDTTIDEAFNPQSDKPRAGATLFGAGAGDTSSDKPTDTQPPVSPPAPTDAQNGQATHPALVAAFNLLETHNIKEATAMQYLRDGGLIDESLTDLKQVSEFKTSALESLTKSAKTAVPAMKRAQGEK